MTTYEAGTVAVATVRGVPNVRVSLDQNHDWFSHEEVECNLWHGLDDVTDVRPLVVLDIDGMDRDDLLCFLRAAHFPYRAAKYQTQPGWLQQIADQIEAQTEPPRIPEPGLWGVVEAGFEAGDGRRKFCRLEEDAEGWSGAGSWFRWSDLIDPTLVRDGI